jgi:hypothetical protein
MMKICYDHRQKARNGRLRDFASKMSPFLNRFLADVRLTHFHRSGTWLTPTDISQTFFTLLFIAFDLIQVRWLGGRATKVARATELDDFIEIDSLTRPANNEPKQKQRKISLGGL